MREHYGKNSAAAAFERRQDAIARINRVIDSIGVALDFLECESENRAAAGGMMSDYEKEPADAAERLNAAITDLKLLKAVMG